MSIRFSLLVYTIFTISCCESLNILYNNNSRARTNTKLQRDFTTSHRQCNFKLNYVEDYHLNTPEIIAKYSLPVEAHSLQTKDGYLLQLFRIPAPGRPVVLLSHGFAASSRLFVINCERRALAIRLADEGFEVWLANFRGNEYSNKHVHYSIDDREYWDFSIDDVTFYDTPAIIDYILKVTKEEKISWIGHSLGNPLIVGLLASQPAYNEKIKMGFVLAGGAAVYNNLDHPVLHNFVPFEKAIYRASRLFMGGKLMPANLQRASHHFLHQACAKEARRKRFGICMYASYISDGFHPGQIAPEVLAVVLYRFPSNVSGKLFSQWLQWAKYRRIALYNYGPRMNLLKYGNLEPPLYDFKQMTSMNRTYVFYGENDAFISAEDVRTGAQMFPQLHVLQVKDPSWNHFDFLLGQDADILVYDTIVSLLKGHSFNKD